jgi:hypothetical protein
MSIDKKVFGLSDSLVSAVNEALKGGQVKLDKNHNGKLDGQDFKMLRKEEVVDEGNPDNKIKKNQAAKKIGVAAARSGDERFNTRLQPHVAAKMLGRKIQKEESEQIDELSTDTYHKAAHKAAKKAMGDAQGRSGPIHTKYAPMARKFQAKGMSQEKKEKAMKEETVSEVSDAAKKVLGAVAQKHGGKVPFTSTTYKDGKKVVTRGHNDEKGNRVVTSTKNEEVEIAEEYKKGDAVTYQKNKKERGQANIHSRSTTKKNHWYINTKDQGTILVPHGELERHSVKEEVEQVDEISKKLAARYNNKVARVVSKNQNSGGDPDKLRTRANREAGHKLSWNKYHNYKVKVPATNEETDPGFVAEADNAIAKQIAAKKDTFKKQLQQKIAAKQMNTMQAKANKRLSSIHASNDKCSCQEGKGKSMTCEVHGDKSKGIKGGKEPIEINPSMKEAAELPKKVITKGHEIAKSLIKHKSKVDNPYAVGMAAAKKSAKIKAYRADRDKNKED